MAIKKSRMVLTMERNRRIGEMDLVELKKYLCMKYGQNPEKCETCPSVSGCPAGQRAIILMNERKLEEMKESKPGLFRLPKAQMVEQARRKFIQALQQPDMIQYIMETDGNTRNCAREKLKHWAKTNRDVAEQYGFAEKFDALTKYKKGTLTGSAAEKHKEAMERYEEAIATEDPIAFVAEKYGISRNKASQKISQWKRKYNEKEDKTVIETAVDEEVSVEDFLKEVESTTQHTEEAAEEEIVPEKQDGGVEPKNDFFGELNAKYGELEKEKEQLMERLAWIEKAQEALSVTLSVFNGK